MCVSVLVSAYVSMSVCLYNLSTLVISNNTFYFVLLFYPNCFILHFYPSYKYLLYVTPSSYLQLEYHYCLYLQCTEIIVLLISATSPPSTPLTFPSDTTCFCLNFPPFLFLSLYKEEKSNLQRHFQEIPGILGTL